MSFALNDDFVFFKKIFASIIRSRKLSILFDIGITIGLVMQKRMARQNGSGIMERALNRKLLTIHTRRGTRVGEFRVCADQTKFLRKSDPYRDKIGGSLER